MPLSIIVRNVSGSRSVPASEDFKDWARAVFVDRVKGEVGIRIVDEDEGRALNKRYRARDYATNVLAFPCEDEFDVSGLETPIGDIVICAAVVEREAREQGKDVRAHWAHMTIHGALHLDGYDHDTDARAQKMESRETLLLAWFGFPDPWQALAPDTPALHHKC